MSRKIRICRTLATLKIYSIINILLRTFQNLSFINPIIAQFCISYKKRSFYLISKSSDWFLHEMLLWPEMGFVQIIQDKCFINFLIKTSLQGERISELRCIGANSTGYSTRVMVPPHYEDPSHQQIEKGATESFNLLKKVGPNLALQELNNWWKE